MNIKERLEKSYTLKEPDFGLDNGVHFRRCSHPLDVVVIYYALITVVLIAFKPVSR
jgi:hypothetical protein